MSVDQIHYITLQILTFNYKLVLWKNVKLSCNKNAEFKIDVLFGIR